MAKTERIETTTLHAEHVEYDESNDKRTMLAIEPGETSPRTAPPARHRPRHQRLSVLSEHAPQGESLVMAKRVRAPMTWRWYTARDGSRHRILETRGPLEILSRHRTQREERVACARSRHLRARPRYR